MNEAVVVEVGAGIDKPLTLKKGDHVLLPSFGGTSVKMNKEEYFLFKDSEILAKLEKQ
jgi:chaperonin GroES